MNAQLEAFARQTLKDGLAKLPPDHHRIFKLMYGRGKLKGNVPERTVEEAEAVPIDQVVDEMPPERLDWAMQQVQNSINKLAKAQNA